MFGCSVPGHTCTSTLDKVSAPYGIANDRRAKRRQSGHYTSIATVGALFLGLIALLPIIASALWDLPNSLALGGTSLLIVVAVVIETMKQIESQLTMREYEGM